MAVREALSRVRDRWHAVTGHRAQPFLILFEGRSGSTYIVQRLDAHPALVCGGEWIETRAGRSPAEQRAFAEAYWTRRRARGVRAAGMKTKLRHLLDADDFRGLLDGLGVRVVLLTRRNLVKWAVSGIASLRLNERLGRAYVRTPDERLPPFAIAPEELDAAIADRRQWTRDLEEYAARLRGPVLHAAYEDMQADEAAFFARLFAFLGVPDLPTRSGIIKATPEELGEMVTNIDELRARYAGSELHAQFDARPGDGAAAG